MRSVDSLLREAVDKCGSQAELGRRIGTSGTAINAMVKGDRPISAETVALVCDVLELPGEEVQRLVALAIIGNAKNAGKRERLRKAFFGCWVVGVFAATLLTGPQDARAAKITNVVSEQTVLGFTPYTLSRILTTSTWLYRLLSRLVQGARRCLRNGLARPFNLHPICAA